MTTADAFALTGIVAELRGVREAWRRSQRRQEAGGRELPSQTSLREILGRLRGALFPMRLGPTDLVQENEDFYVGQAVSSALGSLLVEVRLELRYHARHASTEDAGRDGVAARPGDLEERALSIVRALGAGLPQIRSLLDSDVLAAYQGDPAAHSVDEVLLSYPGIHAMIHHRIAHRLYVLGVPIVARLIAEIAHGETGIDIHPGARIGPGFFIDHGTGVVIGETAEIGSNVRLYQAVTLGAKRFETDEEGRIRKGGPRHPLLEDDVVVYAGATILGRVTIGRGSSIGGNVWLTRSVPAGSRITQASARNESDLQNAGAGI